MQTTKYFYLLLVSYSVDIKMTQYYLMASARKKPLPATTNIIREIISLYNGINSCYLQH